MITIQEQNPTIRIQVIFELQSYTVFIKKKNLRSVTSTRPYKNRSSLWAKYFSLRKYYQLAKILAWYWDLSEIVPYFGEDRISSPPDILNLKVRKNRCFYENMYGSS